MATPKPKPTIRPDDPEVTVDQFLTDLPDKPEEPKRLAMVRLWKKVPFHQQYRIAYPITEGPRRGYESGEIAGAYGLALFIIDEE